MDNVQNGIYARALAEAKGELLSLSHQIDGLSKRKAQVEAVIANLEPLIPQNPAPTLNLFMPDVPIVSNGLPSQPIWKSILLSISDKSDSFSVKDALQALDRIGRGIESPNRFQIVRAVLTKKTENFERIGVGLFRVRKGLIVKGTSEEVP
jgi:hypothetical protein